MSRESLVFIFGIVVFLTPFLGAPSNVKETIIIGAGAILMLIGYSLRRSAYLRSISDSTGERRTDAFVEHQGTRKVEEIQTVEEHSFKE